MSPHPTIQTNSTMEIGENGLEVTKEPLAGANLLTILRLLAQNRFEVDFRYMPRILYSLFLSAVMAPFRIRERIKFDKAIEAIKIERDPVFIIGHWRSGTTYLHNLLSLDERLGFVSTFHAYIPGIFLSSEHIFKPILVSSLPDRRPMDQVIMGADLPQEDEYSIGGLSPYSYYHGWCFPRNMQLYNRFVCLDDVTEKEVKEWKKIYSYLLKKVTLYRGGKRLVLKNPANVARIKPLLEMFPDATFIHISRNPYTLYFSMMKFMRLVIPLYCVQSPPSIEEIETTMMELYVRMYEKYLKERTLIPPGHLVEVKYEDFIADPLQVMERIYAQIDIGDFEASKPAFRDYVASQREYEPDTYEITAESKQKVYQKWGFTFDAFGYDSGF